MRLSTQQFFLQNLDTVSRGNAELFKVQQQLASGKKVQQPSDDPLAMTQIHKFDRVIARTEQFSRNIDVSERRLNLEESTLAQVSDSLLRGKDIAVQAGNGSLSDNDRSIMAEELDQLLGQLTGLVNTQDAQGEYLFSGYRGGTPSYARNAAGRYEFQGDSGQRFLEIGENTTIAATDSGAAIFGSGEANVLNAVQDLRDHLTGVPASPTLSEAQASIENHFEEVVIQRARIGSRLRVLEDQGNALADLKLYTQQTLSKFEDTDYYEATSQLLLQQNALQAAYSSFGKIQQLSLFNVIG
ncbi:flagellar hook-filament junction protein FlgL [Marinobacterium nitratireducens]|uniref:Flagellar hook-filament junction protein FlgL n=1 Tax=Marinobacterium nitratireducens TaxID=518897 RepID=A0A917ZLU1_9GAMM|nr:flagellar hook-associated protein FlgL [Marinobacterium nitratireducens]GGO84923.1 flagellar hook-filament junction protein FlgL [Marinobacterium nitratireducens]